MTKLQPGLESIPESEPDLGSPAGNQPRLVNVRLAPFGDSCQVGLQPGSESILTLVVDHGCLPCPKAILSSSPDPQTKFVVMFSTWVSTAVETNETTTTKPEHHLARPFSLLPRQDHTGAAAKWQPRLHPQTQDDSVTQPTRSAVCWI